MMGSGTLKEPVVVHARRAIQRQLQSLLETELWGLPVNPTFIMPWRYSGCLSVGILSLPGLLDFLVGSMSKLLEE